MENTETGTGLFGTVRYADTAVLDPVTEYQNSVETERRVDATKEKEKPTKKLSQPEVKYGALVVGNEIRYALNIKAKVTTSTNLFGGFGSSLLAGTSESATVEDQDTINTVLLAVVDPKTNDVTYVEIIESSPIFTWLIGDKSAKFEIPTYLNDNLRAIVGKSMTEFKGILNNYAPLNHETQALVSSDVVISNSIKDFTEAAIQLKDAVVTAKKLGGNIGLDGFIERYAFNNHILLAGPRGVKFLHDTIAA